MSEPPIQPDQRTATQRPVVLQYYGPSPRRVDKNGPWYIAWAVLIVQTMAGFMLLVSVGVLSLSVADPPGSNRRDLAMLAIMLSAALFACEYQAKNKGSTACASTIGCIALVIAIPLWFLSASGLYHGYPEPIMLAAPAAGATFCGIAHFRWAARLCASRSDSEHDEPVG